MSTFTLAILFDHFQCALIHGPDIPGSYAILLFTALDLASVTSHIHTWVLFLLWLHPFILLELFLHWSPVAYWAPTALGSSSFSILSFCLFILFMGFSRQEYWSGLLFPSPVDHIVSDLLTMPACLGWPHRAWLIFTELDKAVVLVWLDWLVFCDYVFSVSALWCPLATPTLLLGFFLLWMWVIASGLLQESATIAPYLGWGVSPHHHPSWPSTWDSSSRPSCAYAATTPWMWCGSSQSLPLASGAGLLLPVALLNSNYYSFQFVGFLGFSIFTTTSSESNNCVFSFPGP